MPNADRPELLELVAAIDKVAPRRSRKGAARRVADRSRAVGYLRVSTAEQADSGLGLAAQRTAVESEADRRGLVLVEVLVDEGLSASTLQRPALAEARRRLSTGEVGTLLVAKLDRLTRSVGDLCELMDASAAEGWSLTAADGTLDTSSPMGRLMATVAGAFAELEREMIRQRTRDALAVKRAAGARLGRPVELATEVRYRIGHMRAEGMTLATIAAQLTAEDVPTARGGRWRPSGVAKVLDSLRVDASVAVAT